MSNLQKIADIPPSAENGWKKMVLIRCDEEWEADEWEQHLAFEGFLDAMDHGGLEEAKPFIRKIKFPACSLMATKKLFGADYIRKEGLNTEEADAKYGPGWLDEDHGEPEIDLERFKS